MRMLALMLGAGLLNALIAAVLLCRLPEAHHPSLTSLCLRAAVFVLIGAAAGVMGTFLYWNNPASTFRHNPPLPFSLFALVCAAAWVWIPAMVLFSEQVSAFSACVAAVAALLVAGEVRRLMMQVTRHHEARPAFTAERAMFVETLSHSPANPAGYLVALCVYGAGLAIAGRSNMTAAALLATGAFLFKFSATTLPHQNFTREFAYRRAALRFAAVMIPAILVTAWALLDGVAQRNHLIALRAAGEGNGDSSAQHSKGTNTSHLGKGYESVVLWPYPPKKQIVAPIPEDSLLAPGTKQPVVIRFSGEYWYLQPPDNQPGADAHKAEGTPLDVNISSSNSFPLMMQAHQFLRPAVRLSRCREIRIDIADREDTAADIKASVWLKDSTAKERPSVYLGQLPIVASQKRSFGVGSPPAQVTLSFAVPLTDRKRKFDEITVMLVTDTAHQRVGPHVAIEQFEFIPR
jgi:hypothetical protein